MVYGVVHKYMVWYMEPDLVLGSRRGLGSTPDSRRYHRGSTGFHTELSLLSGRTTRRGTTDRSRSQRTSWWNECSDTGGQTTARSSQSQSLLLSYLDSIDASLISTTMIDDLPEQHVSITQESMEKYFTNILYK